jgi:hypothetical protein
MKRLTILATAWLLLCYSHLHASALTTWEFTATIDAVLDNDLDFPVPFGELVSIKITFDSLSPDIHGHPGWGEYLMSGGATTLQVSIGEHVASPISKFRMIAVTEGCCATTDQYTFASYESQSEQMAVEFPGFLTDAEMLLYFRERHTPSPLDSPAIPNAPPKPEDFNIAHVVFMKNHLERDNRVMFRGSLHASVPEPVGVTTAGIAAVFAFIAAQRLRQRHR